MNIIKYKFDFLWINKFEMTVVPTLKITYCTISLSLPTFFCYFTKTRVLFDRIVLPSIEVVGNFTYLSML